MASSVLGTGNANINVRCPNGASSSYKQQCLLAGISDVVAIEGLCTLSFAVYYSIVVWSCAVSFA